MKPVDLYGPEMVWRYHNVEVYACSYWLPPPPLPLIIMPNHFIGGAVQELGDLADMTPHIFAVGETAFRLMRANGEAAPVSQSIIVSGESGAGKTVTSRYLLQYFAMVAGVWAGQHPL
jgi:myosin heavy subunit